MNNSENLYTDLINLRNKLREQNKTKICTDESIKLIVEMQPKKASDFESIPGLGKVFTEKYAQAFVKVMEKYQHTEQGETIKLNKSSLNTLKELEKKLININKRNNLLYMPRINAKTTLDIYRPAIDARNIIFNSGKMTTMCKNTEPDFKKMVSVLRAAGRNLRDKGQNNLFIAYPFVRGKFASGKDSFNIRAPLAFFPVKEERTASSIKLAFDTEREALYNTTLILANNKFNNINKPVPDSDIDELNSETFLQQLLDFYKTNGLEIQVEEKENEIHAIESFTEDTFPEYRNGEMFLENTIVFGLFSVCSSSIQKDFQRIAQDGKINPLLNDLLMPVDFKSLDREQLKDMSEEKIFYINQLNSAQETVLTALDHTDELVVQGPPGTGKSQTITSLIASFANQNKTVLMVSEKKTALDVVYSRLGDISKYTLLIDDVNNKENFYRQLEKMVDLKALNEVPESSFTETTNSIDKTVDRLKTVASDYYSEDNFGVEPYKLYLQDFFKDMSDEEEFKKAFMIKEALPSEANSLKFPELVQAHTTFSTEEILLKTEDYLLSTKKLPWITKVRADLSDFEIQELKLEYEKINSAKETLSAQKAFKKIPALKNAMSVIKNFVQKYFNPGTKLLKIQFGILKHTKAVEKILFEYKTFIEQHIFYTDLPKSSKIYFDTVLKVKPVTLNKIVEAEQALFEYLPSTHLLDFEAAHRESFPYIKNFDSIINTMEKDMDKKRTLSKKSLESVLSQNIVYLSDSKRRAEIMRVVNSKRKWGVNKFINKFNFELFKAVRVWLLTPEVVSEILPLEMGLFDLVVFDEASQMFMEKGIPSILRAKKVVIAGDQKQLRPSSLGTGRFEIDDDAIEEASDEQTENGELEIDSAILEEDSLLDLARYKYNDVLLDFHYRSQYEELIAFSNYAFYNAKLHVSPNTHTPDEPPIQVLKLDDAKWINRKNEKEAKQVVSLLKKIFKERKNQETIGIITFNTSQRDLIEDLIDKECSSDSEFAVAVQAEYGRKLDGEDIGLFVKNIETVQGDERDIIIFSIGYAPNEKGKLVQNFGWLNQSGGENRLNVAISRAKRKIYIVSSIEPSELKVDDLKNQGPLILKKYLEYAFAVSNKNTELARQILLSVAGISSSVEKENPIDSEDAQQEMKKNLSPFNANYDEYIRAHEEQFFLQFYNELESALKEKNYSIEKNIGIGGYTIDFAVKKDDRYVLGIECDSKLYAEKSSVRERDFYRQKYLEQRGWKIHRLWSELWATNRQGEIEKIMSLLSGK